MSVKNWQRILNLFEACNNAKFLTQLHSITIKSGLNYDDFYAAKLNYLYSKYMTLETTRKLFDETPHKSKYSWNAVLKLYCNEKQYEETLLLFSDMLQSPEKPDHFTVSIVLKACSELKGQFSGKGHYGNIIHGFLKKNGGIDSNLFVGSGLIEFYSKNGNMKDALRVFEEYSEPDLVLWTRMLTSYEQNNEPEQALNFLSRMVKESDLKIDSITLVSVVSACAKLLNLKAGRTIHGFVIRNELDGFSSLLNALLNLYAKAGMVKQAEILFNRMEGKDVIAWGSMISCYTHNGNANEALLMYNKMLTQRIEPNSVIFISALQACEASGNLNEGKKIHELVAQKGLMCNILVSTALIEMYMNCSAIDEAVEIFESALVKDTVSWTAMLSGYVKNGRAFESLGLFRDMLASEVKLDYFSMVQILTSCSELGIFRVNVCFHGYAIKNGFDESCFVRASLIESYSKCGSLIDAIKIFEDTENRDVVIWSTMISGYGTHGKAKEALKLFNCMIKSSKIRPNNVTFLSILAACSHGGLVSEGIEIFNLMINGYDLIPEAKHYAIMVDLLGRIGELEKAMDLITKMPTLEGSSGAQIWGALLGACRIHQNIELGEVAARNLFMLDPQQVGHYVLLSSMYASDGKWEKAGEIRDLVKRKELKKLSGESRIEFSDGVYRFIANDRYHKDSEQIYLLLRNLEVKMREEYGMTEPQLLAA